MGYFDGLTNGSFKKDKNGNTVFFPWGVLGRGHVLSDEASETKARIFVKRYYKVTLLTIMGLGIIMGWVWTLPIAPIYFAWFYFGIKPLIAGCPYSEEKLSLKEGYTNSAKGHNKFTLWLLFIFSVLFVLAGIFIAIYAKSSGQLMLGWSAAIFFGACSAAIGYMLKVNERSGR